jgi:hypothetical protein
LNDGRQWTEQRGIEAIIQTLYQGIKMRLFWLQSADKQPIGRNAGPVDRRLATILRGDTAAAQSFSFARLWLGVLSYSMYCQQPQPMQLAECACAAVATDDFASNPHTLKECLVIRNASST